MIQRIKNKYTQWQQIKSLIANRVVNIFCIVTPSSEFETHEKIPFDSNCVKKYCKVSYLFGFPFLF